MKTKITLFNPKTFSRAFAVAVFMVFWGAAHAQAPFVGGRTYWVDGSGADLVAPKDTFANFSGAYTNGSAYTNTTGIANALSEQGVDPLSIGTVSIIIAPGYSGNEGAQINIGRTGTGGYPNMSIQRPILIKPAAGSNFTISTNATMTANGSVLRLNGAQFVTIDGEGTPGQRNLTFAIASGVTGAGLTNLKVIDIIPYAANGCQYLTIQNCRIVGNSTSGPSAAVNTYAGIYSGGITSTPSAPVRKTQMITISNNMIEAVQNPIYVRGMETVANGQDLGLIVRNNILGGTVQPGEPTATTYIGGAANAAGISVIAQKNAVVENNTIRNNMPGGGNFRGIALLMAANNTALDSNVVVNANKIYNLRSSVAASGVGGIRVSLGSHTQSLAIKLTNNTIGKVFATSGGTAIATVTGYTAGILIEDASANAGIDIFNNSVHLFGDTLNVGSFSGCIVLSANVQGGIRVANNILVNRLGRTLFTTGATPTSYVYIVNHATANPFTLLRNNAYFANNTTGSFSFIGYITGKPRQSLDAWVSASSDVSSVTTYPTFIGTNDSTLTIANGAATTIGNAGTSVGVTSDINGNTRSTTTPSIGAYEFTGNSATARYALTGGITYPINGTSAWPVGAGAGGSFATLADAITYVNTFGVTGAGNITLQFAPGYAGETTMIPHILDYSGAASNRVLVIRPSANNSYTVSAPEVSFINNQYAVLNMIGARYVTIEGQSVTGQRNLTFSVPGTITGNVKVISVSPSDVTPTGNIIIRNCNITGSSSTTAINTAYGIYHGNYNATSVATQSAQVGSNHNMTFTNNNIVAVRTGIYLRGANILAGQNKNYLINKNIIGGFVKRGDGQPLTYVGGAADQAGIYLKGIANSTVDSNIVRNIDSATNVSDKFRGIDLDNAGETNGVDSNLVISRNTIYNLVTVTGQWTTGIRVSLGSVSDRRIRLVNNAIAKIRAAGASSAGSVLNPSGILVDGTSTNLGLEIFNNTVQLSGTSLSGANASAALAVGANITGGVKVQNNILSNRLGRSSGLSGSAYAMYSGAAIANSPFQLASGGFLNSNAYGADGVNTQNNYLVGQGSTNYQFITQWQSAVNGDLTSVNFNAAFMTDSTITPDLAFSGILSDGSLTISDVTTDIKGAARGAVTTSTGALVFTKEFLPLQGGQTYLINGANNYPTPTGTAPFSFATINRAIEYLNANGVDDMTLPAQKVRLVISAGYTGETDPMLTAIKAYPRMNINRIVSLTTSAGRSDTIRTTGTYAAHGSVIRFNGGSFFEIDGNNGSGGRNITIALPAAATVATLKLIDITPGDVASRNITIKNCNLIGNSNGASIINTYAGIYTGGITATPSFPIMNGSNNHVFENNFIGAVKYGIYMQGIVANQGQQDLGSVIRKNIIGGTTTSPNTDYFGGVASAAGIFLSSQANATVDSNVIRNNVGSFIANRGIDLATSTGALSIDSNITITRNTIYRISNTTGAGAAYGISINLGADSMANITVANNMISAITAAGTASSGALSLLNPFGIFVDATAAVRDLGLRIWYNSINLGPATTLATTNNGVSACLAFGSNIRGGVRMQNNILQNRLGRTSGTGYATSVFVGHSDNIFTISDNNNYFSSGANATNTVAIFSATAATQVRYNTLDDYMAYTNQDSMSLNFVTNFVNDESDLSLQGVSGHVVYAWGVPVAGITTDKDGSTRSASQPTIGADEITGIFADSIPARIYNITTPVTASATLPFPNVMCPSGDSITITYRIFKRTNDLASDTLYYSVNNGPELFVRGVPSPTSRFTRTFKIPTQPNNTSIAYRVAINDNSGRRVVFPASGYQYTSTIFETFPLAYGFDLPNTAGWTVQSYGPDGMGTPAAGGWKIDSYGSPLSPVVTPRTGIKAALFEASVLPSGTASMLVSPCVDLSKMKVPTLRIWVSQNDGMLNNADLVQVRVTGGISWSAPLAAVVRPNPSASFAEFKQLDVCLTTFPFVAKIAIEAVSRGGQNIVLDSIVIFDDVINQPITPATNTICAYDQMTLNIPNSSSNYAYRLVNPKTGLDLSPEYTGNGGALAITGPNPNNIFSGVIDSTSVIIGYRNLLSGCSATLNDTSKVYIKVFHGGPFIAKGAPFSGVYNAGTSEEPDGADLTSTLTYDFIPPSGLTNASYGTSWTVLSTSVRTSTNIPISSAVFAAPAGGANAKYTIKPAVADADSVFILKATVRLLPTNCDSVITRYIKVVSAPAASFTNLRDTVCQGATIVFNNTTTFLPATGPLTYLWEFSDGTTMVSQSASKIFLAPAGLYTVKLTAFNNAGVSNSVSKQIRVLARPVSSFTTGQACGTDSVQITNTTTGAITYLWTNRLNGVVQGPTTTVQNPKFSFAISDTLYDLTLRATNTDGCFKDTTIGVFSFSKPVAAFSIANHCLGKPATFVNNTTIVPGANGRVNTFGSSWDFGNGDEGLSNTPDYSFRNNGTFTVKLKATSNYGCIDSTTRTVTVYDRPRVGFTKGIACQDEGLTLTNTTTYSGVANKVVYAWDFGDFTTSADLNPTKTYGSLGTFPITLIAHDTVNFCYDTVTQVVEVNEKPVALFSASSGCVNGDVPFNNGSIPPPGQTLTYSWDFGGATPNTSTETNPTTRYAASGSKTVTLVTTTNKGCSHTATNTVEIAPIPDARWSSTNTECNVVRFVPGNLGEGSYRWDFGDGTIANTDDKPITNTYQRKGRYGVTLSIDRNGCTSSFTDSVTTTCTVGMEEAFITKFNLSVYPNPFTDVANISYNLNEKQNVTVSVFDVLGRNVAELNYANQVAGNHTISLDESKFSSTSAIYMVRIQIGQDVITKQLMRQH
jgi:PKD repeat protein